MKKRLISIMLLPLLLFASCAGKTGETEDTTAATDDITDELEEDGVIQILADPLFKNGFICGGAAHEDGIIGTLVSPAATGDPQWKIAQWACKNDISQLAAGSDGGGYAYYSDSQTVAVSWLEGPPLLMMELKASREYDAPRQWGEPWPHLLIEQTDLAARCPKFDQVEQLNLILDVQLTYCTEMMDEPDPGLHAAQLQLFFTVQSYDTGDCFWFGIPMFDNRTEIVPEYKAQDVGKDDASGLYIYTVAQTEFTDKSFHSFERIRYEIDLLPFVRRGIRDAYVAGYLNSRRLSDFQFTTCNLGYEMPGIYDSAFGLYEFSVTAVMKRAEGE